MSTGEIQYIADSILIEKVVKLDVALTKEAGLVNDIFSGVGSAVSSYVKSNVDFSSPAGTAKSVLKLLAPGMLFRVHPLLAFLYYIANEYGYDIVGTIDSIVDSISGKINAGEPVSPEEINQAALAKSSSVNNDLFYGLRELEKTGTLLKSSKRGGKPIGGSFFGVKGAPILSNLFGFLDRSKSGAGKSLLVGFVAWFIKTILLSAGLLAIGAGAKKVIQTGKDAITNEDGTKIDSISEPNQKTKPIQEKEMDQEKAQENDTSWYMPIINGSLENTVLAWVSEFYPDLSEYEDIILKTNSFNSVIRDLSGKISGSYLVVPGNFDKKSTVDRFVRDVEREIDKLKNEAK